MKPLLVILFTLIGWTTSIAQSQNPKYNKSLADSLGADDYGMKMYTLVILKTGENKSLDKKTRDSLFRGHFQNVRRLADEGKLIIAGPMENNDKHYEGIFVLNVKTIDEAKKLLDTDPTIKAKLLDPELYQWYASAALPMFMKYHDNVKKKDF